jgi:hypothetical protein
LHGQETTNSNMEEYIKLICNQGNSEIEFTINPHITLDEMVENMECFLKAVGYQFDHLEWVEKQTNSTTWSKTIKQN